MAIYYVNWFTGTKRPKALYRFYEKTERRAPEYYGSDSVWVEDSNLYLRLMNGEIDGTNIISEEEATRIAAELDRTRGRTPKPIGR